MAVAMGLEPILDSIQLEELTGPGRLTDEVLSRLVLIVAGLSDRERQIALERIFSLGPKTLQQLGDQFGLTRERVRQISERLQRRLNARVQPAVDTVADIVRHELGPVVVETQLRQLTDDLFSHAAAAEAEFASAMLRSTLNYSCEGGTCLSKDAIVVVKQLQTHAQEHADDVGLVEEAKLQSELPDGAWIEHWPALISRTGLHRLSGQLALRNTQRATVKAALVSLEEPATRDEIAAVAGVTPTAAGSQLSNIPSVIRADKLRWALSEWIDEEYAGIAGEIIQRIEDDGGATSLHRLLNELPQRFGVSESSVRAYAYAPQFVVEASFVRMAADSEITLRNIDDVIDGRDSEGAPYWTFIVQERYFGGYSLVGVPPEFAVALGCVPNGDLPARVLNPRDCRDLSVIWSLTSLVGASIGYLTEPLQRLGVSAGDRVGIVIREPGAVELYRSD